MPEAVPPNGSVVLSFLPPSEEVQLQGRFDTIVYARAASKSVRSEARELYLKLAARAGLIPARPGNTLRHLLARSGEASRWWYHPVSFKDCESDPTFDWIIALLTIRAVAGAHGARDLVLAGVPQEIVSVLRCSFAVTEHQTRRRARWLQLLAQGCGGRAKFFVSCLLDWRASLCLRSRPRARFDAVFSGFLDSSFWRGEDHRVLEDRYFKNLVPELTREYSSIGWFAWLDLHGDPSQPARKRGAMTAPFQNRDDVVLLQGLLRPLEILRAAADFGPLMAFLRARHLHRFAVNFQQGGVNYYPLFDRSLLRGFLDANIPRCELVATATARACAKYQPGITLSFLEHFPYSRAHYEGVRRSRPETICCAVQHASYCRDKTFLYLHPSLEFRGDPDGCAVPHPQRVFAMGDLGRALFLECGYREDQVQVTGSPRYDHISITCGASDLRPLDQFRCIQTSISILMVSSLAADVDIDMIAAVCLATAGLNGIRLIFRKHPFSRVHYHPDFSKYRSFFELSTGALAEDLATAAAILFTSSTVAEEAFVAGKAVWQWLPFGANRSAIAEVTDIRSFASVADLREHLVSIHRGHEIASPPISERLRVMKQLFSPADGDAARRIAWLLRPCVNEHSATH